ncbi:MAG: 5-methyltetrahydropteroyltriglutamate--homocysteine S-methyltransferase, partial [Candidatus Margulisbacteria bacterium]|nr:5-methyltetrahydropteroyltriglutamate--homocysteine S-methyltransferase [Candidatus Margulisiibacteriota bacterium]
MNTQTMAFGYPKIGPNRELKKTVESYWKGDISQEELIKKVSGLSLARIQKQLDSGLDWVPSSDFSLYDQMLDHSQMLGVIPDRFKGIENTIDQYFAMARGSKDAIACEMTKWFDTNYHYIVPELTGTFTITENTPLKQYKEAKEQLGIKTVPVMIGPFTFIYLSKCHNDGNKESTKAPDSPHFKEWVLEVAKLYRTIIKELEAEGANKVLLNEPALVLNTTKEEVDVLIEAYSLMTKDLSLDIHVNTYYESLTHFEDIVTALPVKGIGLDFVSNQENMIQLKSHGMGNKALIAGVISGRNPWKSEPNKVISLVNEIKSVVVDGPLTLSNAAPLYHLPHSLEYEKDHLSSDVLRLLAFADERLIELETLKNCINGSSNWESEDLSDIKLRFQNSTVQEKINQIQESQIGRKTPFSDRYKQQQAKLNLPLFPTTTIGSFPQTAEVRQKRAQLKSGNISQTEYDGYVQDAMKELVTLQEDIGLDVLVHGEFERTDMVEFFGEKMDGFAFTKNGWVQSYGSRCVRPPIIYGDVSRPNAMTVKETIFAQGLTQKPMKGMLTGPVTILNWSFYRNDIPKKEIAYQIGLALREEVLDLEKENISII